jgi:hexosaminidase
MLLLKLGGCPEEGEIVVSVMNNVLICGFFSGVLMMTLAANAAPSVIPQPVSIEMGEGTFSLREECNIIVSGPDDGAADVAKYLGLVLRPSTGYALPVRSSLTDVTARDIHLAIQGGDWSLGEEGYILDVTSQGVSIVAAKPAGLFYGAQTLRQLLPTQVFNSTKVNDVAWTIPCVHIEDYPRFEWRGLHLDTARHFMPVEFVKRYIDLLALHKMNSFHWHLTEDQGWRIEIKKYPKLTEVGAWREETLVGHMRDEPKTFDGKRHGGFYTQDEIRDVVAYAAARYVNVVPEIEMPGHAQAAVAAYPELGNLDEPLQVMTYWGISPNIFNANEKTILFLQDVLTEVLDLFPSKFIHIGGDEAIKDQWEASETVQARIKELGLKDEHELQSYIIRRMDTFLSERGRRLIGWDEILEGGLAKGATVMSWRGDAGGIAAAKAGNDVVMAPHTHTYFDFYQGSRDEEPLAIGGFLPLETVYSFEPLPAALSEEEAKHILGAQSQLWTEYVETPAYAEYMSYPRACALAEVVWTPKAKKDYGAFTTRLEQHVRRFDALGVNYRKLTATPKPDPSYDPNNPWN